MLNGKKEKKEKFVSSQNKIELFKFFFQLTNSNHGTMHGVWYRCKQGSCLTGSESLKSSQQTEHWSLLSVCIIYKI